MTDDASRNVVEKQRGDHRPRILFLSNCLAFPPKSGGRTRTLNILKQLSREFDVSLVPFYRREHQSTAEERESARAQLQEIVDEVARPSAIPAEQRTSRRLLDHLRSTVTGQPYCYYQFETNEFRSRLVEVVDASPPDLVHLDCIDLYRWLDDIPDVPVACTHHDIESSLLRKRATTAPGLPLKAHIRRQADLVQRVESQLCPSFDINIVMSPLDEDRLLDVAPGSETLVVPNAVDLSYFSAPAVEERIAGRVVFVGPTHLFANRNAADYLLSDIWPRVREQHGDATLELVGKATPETRSLFGTRPGVESVGEVPDIRRPLERAECSVVPIRVGGGTRIKILESWAAGLPVVSTPVGAEGLETSEGKNILIREDPASFADAVVEVLEDQSLRERLAAGGRDTVERRYSWDHAGRQLRQAYSRTLDGAGAVSDAAG